MIVDLEGVVHPSLNDVPTGEGWVHIAGCEYCSASLGPDLVKKARQMTEAIMHEERSR